MSNSHSLTPSAVSDEALASLRHAAREITANGGPVLDVHPRGAGFRLLSRGESLISEASYLYCLAYLRGYCAATQGPGLFAVGQPVAGLWGER